VDAVELVGADVLRVEGTPRSDRSLAAVLTSSVYQWPFHVAISATGYSFGDTSRASSVRCLLLAQW
jgi:hypothetical protein